MRLTIVLLRVVVRVEERVHGRLVECDTPAHAPSVLVVVLKVGIVGLVGGPRTFRCALWLNGVSLNRPPTDLKFPYWGGGTPALEALPHRQLSWTGGCPGRTPHIRPQPRALGGHRPPQNSEAWFSWPSQRQAPLFPKLTRVRDPHGCHQPPGLRAPASSDCSLFSCPSNQAAFLPTSSTSHPPPWKGPADVSPCKVACRSCPLHPGAPHVVSSPHSEAGGFSSSNLGGSPWAWQGEAPK